LVTSIAFLIGLFSITIWTVLLFGWGKFWLIGASDADRETVPSPTNWPSVVAVVPARNEAPTIGRSVASLTRQEYSGKFRIVIVDDHSDDGTASVAARSAKENGGEGKVEICAAGDLPAGWTGKVWAMNEGLKSAGCEPAYYWLTDADIVHGPDTLQRLVSRAEWNLLDLTSLMVLLHAKTLPERALIPAFLYFFLQLYPPLWIAQAQARTAGAAGGCILLRAAALKKIGGLETIRGEVIDDCALAKKIKRSGGSVWMGVTRQSVSLRVYNNWKELRDMITRTAFTQLNYSAWLLVATLVGLILIYLVPVFLLFAKPLEIRFLGMAALAMMTISFFPTIRFYRLSPLWALMLPFAALFYSYATCVSALRVWLGRGGQWKGRNAATGVSG
jgi:hopene-associated glycosyltransferase HpnB